LPAMRLFEMMHDVTEALKIAPPEATPPVAALPVNMVPLMSRRSANAAAIAPPSDAPVAPPAASLSVNVQLRTLTVVGEKANTPIAPPSATALLELPTA